MNNKDKIEHIMALHNGELGVTWEGHDVVTPDTIAKLDHLIQDERKETVEEYKQRIIELECEIVRLLSDKIDKDALQDLLKELTKGGDTE